MKNETLSAQTKTLILELLSSDPGKSYNWAEMREHVNHKLKITDGIFAGSVQALSYGGKIVRVNRGVYALANNIATERSRDSLSPQILKILTDAENSIKQEADGITILMLEESDFLKIRHIQKLLTDLADLRTKFEQNVTASNNA